MNEWNIVLVIIALGGFIITLIKTLTPLTNQISVLNTNMKYVSGAIEKLTSNNEQEHKEICTTINDHEVRITLMEKWRAKQ